MTTITMDRYEDDRGLKLMIFGSVLLAFLVIFIFLNSNTTAAALLAS